MAKNKGPALTKFTPDRVKLILQDISDHVPYKIAAEANGIGESTFYDWLLNGARDFKAGIDSDYTRLVESLRTVERERIKDLVGNVRDSSNGHKGAQWTLEHVFWRHFSSNAAVIDFNERLSKIEETESKRQDAGDKPESKK